MSMNDPLDTTPPLVTSAVDAKNRALRTFLYGLGIDVVVALGLLLLPIFGSAGSFNDLDWTIIVFSVVKTLVLTVVSYVLRRAGVLPSTITA